MYNKPTNIWTTRLKWTPERNSGNGKCGGEGVCEAGYVNPKTGHWKHLKAIGQEAWRLAQGEEQEETKGMVPACIQQEMFAAARCRRDGIPIQGFESADI